MIEIVYGYEILDNWGNIDKFDTNEKLFNILSDSQKWTDDMVFLSKDGVQYSIEDLIGFDIIIAGSVITIKDNI